MLWEARSIILAEGLYVCVCFRHKTCGSEDCFKIVKFWVKTTSHVLYSGDADDVQRRSTIMIKKIITGDEWWVYGYDIETKA